MKKALSPVLITLAFVALYAAVSLRALGMAWRGID